jgi:hypothetical protein
VGLQRVFESQSNWKPGFTGFELKDTGSILTRAIMERVFGFGVLLSGNLVMSMATIVHSFLKFGDDICETTVQTFEWATICCTLKITTLDQHICILTNEMHLQLQHSPLA